MRVSSRRLGPALRRARRGPRRLPRWLNPRTLTALVALSVLIGGGWFVVRDAGLVAVENVEVTGATGPQAGAIRDALTTAGRDMTTLHIEQGALDEAVAPFAVVRSVAASAALPNTLRVRVTEHVPVAALASDGAAAVPVAGDGTVLRGVAAGGLPVVDQALPPTGDLVTERRTRRLLELLDRAPRPLRAKAARAYLGQRGLTVRLTNGPLVNFGSGTRLRAKWASLVAVLSSPASLGATAIDVRVPEHPAAAGLEQRSTQLGQPSTGN